MQHSCKTTEYKSTDSPFPLYYIGYCIIYRDQQSNGLNPHKFSSGYMYCTVYNLRLWIFVVFSGFKILFRLYLLSPLPLKNPKNP